MKKITTLWLAAFLVLTMLFLSTSCVFRHPIDDFEKKIEKAENYQIAMTISVSDFTVSQITKVDGNIAYTSANETLGTPETYVEEIDDEIYEYKKDSSGKWRKSKQVDNEDDWTDELLDLLDSKNYEKIKGEKNKYRQKDSVVFESFDEVRITVEKDAMIIKCEVVSEGVTMDLKLVFSKIGQINLELPEIGSK